MTASTVAPALKAGDRTVVTVRTGYKLVQHRPFDCRHGVCVCDTSCNGVVTDHPGTVEDVIYYADNSVEATVLCDDGVRRIERLSYPSGDVCF